MKALRTISLITLIAMVVMTAGTLRHLLCGRDHAHVPVAWTSCWRMVARSDEN